MLLIGSRAIIHHFPDFRPPRDWDLVGTTDDIERLDRVLPRADDGTRTDKVHYRRGETIIEVANASEIPYWGRVMATFEEEPTIEDPDLGVMHVAPASYLLLTKQCGLIYRILHWHKNLEDLYFLRDRIPTIPDQVAALLPDVLADSRRMFGALHSAEATSPTVCHPKLRGPPEPELHAELHRRLALEGRPAVDMADAWGSFPELTGDAKRQAMIRVFAEEAMVLAATGYLRPGGGNYSARADELTRWALRTLITGDLPEGWRYFGVNYYREIRARIPEDWFDRLGALVYERVFYEDRCEGAAAVCEPCDRTERIAVPVALTRPTR